MSKYVKTGRPIGRPPKLTPAQKLELVQEFKEYIAITDDPTIASFVSYNKMAIELMITKDDIYEWKDFSEHTKRAIAKQEAYLLTCVKNPAMAIFRLKQPQHGYKDRIDTDITTGGEKLGVVTPVDPRLVAGWTEYLKDYTLGIGDITSQGE